MTHEIESQPGPPRARSKTLLAATSLFGLLYLWFIVVSLFPAREGSWISTTVPFEPFDREQIFVKLLFLLFLVGCVVLWRNEMAAGAIFLLWWVAMWCVEIFVVEPIKSGDAGGGIVMGFPLFVLGVLYVWRGYRGRHVQPLSSEP